MLATIHSGKTISSKKSIGKTKNRGHSILTSKGKNNNGNNDIELSTSVQDSASIDKNLILAIAADPNSNIVSIPSKIQIENTIDGNRTDAIGFVVHTSDSVEQELAATYEDMAPFSMEMPRERLICICRHWKRYALCRRFMKHGDQQLRGAYFQRWLLTTRHLRHESWRSTVRADLFHWRILSTRVWSIWTQLVNRKRYIKLKEDESYQHAQKRLKSKVMEALTLYHRHRNMKKQLNLLAREQRFQGLLRRIYRFWQSAARDRMQKRRNEKLAKINHENSLKLIVFKTWYHSFQLLSTQRDLLKVSEHVHTQNAMRFAFGIWDSLYNREKLRRKTLALAEGYYYLQLKKSIFNKWAILTSRQVVFSKKIDWMQSRIASARLQEYFYHWIQDTNWRIDTEARIASYFTKKKLALRHQFLQGLKHLVQANHEAVFFHKRTVMKRELAKWNGNALRRRKARDEAEMKPADNQFNHRLMRRSFSTWFAYARIIMKQKQQNTNAIIFYQRSISRRYFFQWSSTLLQFESRRRDIRFAGQYYKQVVLEKAFSMWYVVLQDKKYEKKMEKMASHARDCVILKKAFTALRSHAHGQIQERQANEMSVQYYRSLLLSKVIRAWNIYRSQQDRKYELERTAVSCRYRAVAGKIWKSWQKALISKNQERIRWQLAEAHFERAMSARILKHWHEYVVNKYERRKAIWAIHRKRQIYLLRTAMKQWMVRMESANESMELADTFVLMKTREQLTAILSEWKRYAVSRNADRIRDSYCVSQVQMAHFQNSKLNCFKLWRKKLDYRRWQLKLAKSAKKFEYLKLARAKFNIWKQRRASRLHERELESVADKQLTKRIFSIWHHKNPDWKVVYSRLFVKPCKLNSDRLLRKSLNAWKRYATIRRESVEKIVQEERRRREILKKEGIRLWNDGYRAADSSSRAYLTMNNTIDCDKITVSTDAHETTINPEARNGHVRIAPRIHSQRPQPKKPGYIFDHNLNAFVLAADSNIISSNTLEGVDTKALACNQSVLNDTEKQLSEIRSIEKDSITATIGRNTDKNGVPKEADIQQSHRPSENAHENHQNLCAELDVMESKLELLDETIRTKQELISQIQTLDMELDLYLSGSVVVKHSEETSPILNLFDKTNQLKRQLLSLSNDETLLRDELKHLGSLIQLCAQTSP